MSVLHRALSLKRKDVFPWVPPPFCGAIVPGCCLSVNYQVCSKHYCPNNLWEFKRQDKRPVEDSVLVWNSLVQMITAIYVQKTQSLFWDEWWQELETEQLQPSGPTHIFSGASLKRTNHSCYFNPSQSPPNSVHLASPLLHSIDDGLPSPWGSQWHPLQ